MSKWKDREEPLKDEFKPKLSDALALAAKLAKYSPIKINGRIQYPFFQYLAEQNIIKFDDTGQAIILNVSEFHRLTQLNDLREWKRDKDLLADFEQFPEEKELHYQKISKIVESVRGMMVGKRIGDTENITQPI